MKNHLGKIMLFFLLPLLLFADSHLADYTLHASKKEPVVKEAVVITFIVKQKDHATNMRFIFEPQKSENYKTALLSIQSNKDSPLHRTTTFQYLLFPLKSGDLSVNFDFSVQIETSGPLTDFYTGHNDGIIRTKMTLKKLENQSLRLHVSPLKEHVDLVGDFTLDSKLLKNEINQYGAAKINYTLGGVGYHEESLQALGKINNVTAFFQTNNKILKATPEGIMLKKEYMYALSSKNGFAIPAIQLTAYSPKNKKYYTLKTPSYKVKVNTIDPATLLDTKEFPQNSTLQLSDFKEFFIGIVLFLAGFISAKFSPKWSFKRQKKSKFTDIKETATAKELILVLMQNYPPALVKESIEALEGVAYKNSEQNFAKIKRELLKKLM